METLCTVAVGLATGISLLLVFIGAMRAREDQIRRILDDDFMSRPDDWGRQ